MAGNKQTGKPKWCNKSLSASAQCIAAVTIVRTSADDRPVVRSLIFLSIDSVYSARSMSGMTRNYIQHRRTRRGERLAFELRRV